MICTLNFLLIIINNHSSILYILFLFLSLILLSFVEILNSFLAYSSPLLLL
nr:MAG TPA: hypothetical protein [Caudoviricetes sp.]